MTLTDVEKRRIRKGLMSRLTSGGELLMSSQSSRSQAMNKEDVTERFLTLIEKLSKPQKRRIKTKPTKAAKERRLKEKKVRSERKKGRGKPGDE